MRKCAWNLHLASLPIRKREKRAHRSTLTCVSASTNATTPLSYWSGTLPYISGWKSLSPGPSIGGGRKCADGWSMMRYKTAPRSWRCTKWVQFWRLSTAQHRSKTRCDALGTTLWWRVGVKPSFKRSRFFNVPIQANKVWLHYNNVVNLIAYQFYFFTVTIDIYLLLNYTI